MSLDFGLPPDLGPNYGQTLPTVSNPDQAMADITREDYLRLSRNFDQFERNLINKAKTDTSLIDQAREDAETTQTLTAGITQRNMERYGANLTPAQRQQRGVSNQLSSTLGTVNSVNNARLTQADQNQALLGDLINIGQGLNRSSLNQLGVAAQSEVQKRNQHTQNKHPHNPIGYKLKTAELSPKSPRHDRHVAVPPNGR